MCGEKVIRFRNNFADRGSPPHVRGKGTGHPRKISQRRITPACAGKSYRGREEYNRVRDHPRMCGEKRNQFRPDQHAEGSPPHVRGKELIFTRTDGKRGITPACAGKSTLVCFLSCLLWDHPRMCGEKDYFTPYPQNSRGSPPHVRGKEKLHLQFNEPPRITPACAGKRLLPTLTHWRRRDHPRMCGEKPLFSFVHILKQGSPPHVRGKVPAACVCTAVFRITPACAGKRSLRAPCQAAGGDHPRMCGEKFSGIGTVISGAGSPPHVRGKVHQHPYSTSWRRITPACAGKSEDCLR